MGRSYHANKSQRGVQSVECVLIYTWKSAVGLLDPFLNGW